jgi:hypothetical protein
VVIGDSHEHDEAIEPFDKDAIDPLILDYLRQMVRLADWALAGRWHGLYAQHPALPVYSAGPRPGATVVASPGRAGMTLSFGLAEDWWAAGTAAAPSRQTAPHPAARPHFFTSAGRLAMARRTVAGTGAPAPLMLRHRISFSSKSSTRS